MIAGIGGAVVAVPLVAVLNTVVSYLKSYSQEPASNLSSKPRGATAVSSTPTDSEPSDQAP